MPPKISQIVNVKVGGCDGYCSCKGKKKCGKPRRKTASRRAGSASSPGGFTTGSAPRRYMTNSIGSGASVMVRDGLPILMDGNRHVSSEVSNAVSSQRFKAMIDEAISKQNEWLSQNVNRQGETRGNSLLSMECNNTATSITITYSTDVTPTEERYFAR